MYYVLCSRHKKLAKRTEMVEGELNLSEPTYGILVPVGFHRVLFSFAVPSSFVYHWNNCKIYEYVFTNFTQLTLQIQGSV